MSARRKGDKGYDLEELLRAYFIRAGSFVVRGVPLRHMGDDVTDVDLWTYDRPTGSSRRRHIVDAKSKTRPKAIERLLWTKGLVEYLKVDGAYVATTDNRPMLRNFSKRLDIGVFDGIDLSRIRESGSVLFDDRISEEEFCSILVQVDGSRRNKDFVSAYDDLKVSLVEAFGSGTLNRSLDIFGNVARFAVSSHPNSQASEASLRIVYFAASLVALSIDYIMAEVSFRSAGERRERLLNAIRFGNPDFDEGFEKVRVAVALVERFSSRGSTAARELEVAARKEFDRIPAEIVADYAVKAMKGDDAFRIARQFESLAFAAGLAGFDALPTDVKALLAVLLDYADVQRGAFASAWSGIAEAKELTTDAQPALFSVVRGGSAP